MADMKKIATRVSYGNTLVELARQGADNLVVFDADLAAATKTEIFRKEFPDRHFDCGIAEQNMVGVAAGMSTMGYVPFVSSFAKVGNALLSTLGTLKSIRFLHSSRPVRSVMGGAPLLLLTDNTCKLSKCRRSAREVTGSYVPSTLTAQAASCSLLLTFPPMSTPSGASLTRRSFTPVPEFIETR